MSFRLVVTAKWQLKTSHLLNKYCLGRARHWLGAAFSI